MNEYIQNLGKVRPTPEGIHKDDVEYDILCIVTDKYKVNSYISKKAVPIGISLNNDEYWQPLCSSTGGGSVPQPSKDYDEEIKKLNIDLKDLGIALNEQNNIITNHINNTTIHVTEQERQKWNQGLAGETYIADEEDITLVQDKDSKVFKFKNRDSSNGIGYVILRKDNIKTQMNKTNTIYEVRYDYDLNGETLEIPENCVLKFNGGSFENGTIEGNNTQIDGYPTYSIFNDCNIKGFNIGFIDVRWVGAVPDFDIDTISGTDNSIYFDRAIKQCGNNAGSYVKVVGQYLLATSIEVKYDLNLTGEYHPNRTHREEVGVEEYGCPSLIYVPANVTAFKVIGRGDSSMRSSHLFINNIKFIGESSDASTPSILIEYTATGAPTRVGKFAECLCRNFNKVLYFHDKDGGPEGTIYGNLTIEKVVAYFNKQFIVATVSQETLSNKPSFVTLCNLKIKDSNIEQNGDKAIYLERLFGPNVIENCLLENSPNVIYATIFGGSLEIINNYFEQQGGEDMVYVKGHNANNCFLTCTNNYRVNADSGKKYTFHSLTIVDFNTAVRNINDVVFSGCIIDKNLWSKLTLSGIDVHARFKELNFYKAYPFDDFAYPLLAGSDKLANGLLGKSGFVGNSRLARVNCNVVKGDIIYLCYYSGATSQYTLKITDDNGALLSETAPVLYGGEPGVQFFKFIIEAESSNYVNILVDAKNNIDFGNGFIFKNLDITTSINKLGIMLPNYLSGDYGVEYKTAESLRGTTFISEATFDGMYYSDGNNIRNSDGSLQTKTIIVSKYVRDSTFSRQNTIYKIAADLDLNGYSIQMPSGCTLDFSLGGTITNGNIRLSSTRLIPYGLSYEDIFIGITPTGINKTGQIVYDSILKKQKLWNGDEWVNLDGTPLT